MLSRTIRGSSRGVLAAFSCAVAIGILAGCVPFVPTIPNDQPLALTVRDGEVWFQWCGPTTDEYAFMSITFRSPPETNDETAAAGIGRYRFSDGLEFSTSVAPEGLTYSVSRGIPVTSGPLLIFVNPGNSSSDLASWWVSFETDSLADLSSGLWLQPSGSITKEPCAPTQR